MPEVRVLVLCGSFSTRKLELFLLVVVSGWWYAEVRNSWSSEELKCGCSECPVINRGVVVGEILWLRKCWIADFPVPTLSWRLSLWKFKEKVLRFWWCWKLELGVELYSCWLLNLASRTHNFKVVSKLPSLREMLGFYFDSTTIFEVSLIWSEEFLATCTVTGDRDYMYS